VAKKGTEKRPIILRVRTMARAEQVAAACDAHGIHFILGIEPDKPEDIGDLERAVQAQPVRAVVKVGRNDPCPCGSGRKFKRCCALASA
jgi:SWIM/SEC-C metal-binding protein